MVRSWRFRRFGSWLALLALFTVVMPVHGESLAAEPAIAGEPPCHLAMGMAPEAPADEGAVQPHPHCQQAQQGMGGCHCVQAMAAVVTPSFHLQISLAPSPLGQGMLPPVSPLKIARFRPPILSLYG